MSRFVVVPAIAVCLLAAALFAPSLLRGRELVAATPSPRPLFEVTPLELAPGTPLCLTDVTIPADARQARLQVITGGAPGPRLTITLQAAGYAQRLVVPAGYADETTVAPRLEPPATARLGQVCIVNEGTRAAALTATTEVRTQSRPEGRVNGRPVAPDTYLAFYEDATASPLARTPAIIDRMGAFRPAVVGPWLLWPLLALVVVGVPAGLVWALQRAAR